MNILDDTRSKKERRRALEVEAHRVRCPKCGAMAGDYCVANELGEPAVNSHRERIRLSTYKPVPR